MTILKRFPPLLPLFISLFISLFVMESHAAVLTDIKEVEKEVEKEIDGFIPDGYRYYISHFWDYDGGLWNLTFYKDKPTFSTQLYREQNSNEYYYHVYSSDKSFPLFYDFSSEEDLLNFIYSGGEIVPDDLIIRENYVLYMRMNENPEGSVYHTNSDLIFSDTGKIYQKYSPYTETITEVVPSTDTYIVGDIGHDTISTLFRSLFLPILPPLLIVFIGYIGIRKGISFIMSILGGV